MSRGQALEAEATVAALAEAVRCYDSAIALLSALRTDDPATNQRDLAIAWMNRGNALHKQATPESAIQAVRAYDEAIALLGGLPGKENHSWRNSLGAAWMNRGLALHQQGTAESVAAAVHSHGEAIAVLRSLPLDESPWYRRNLAAAYMNQANALLDSQSPDRLAAAGDAARAALTPIAREETVDPLAADLALKARRVLCDMLGQQLAVNETLGLSNAAAADEASDAIDASLTLVRHWEQQGVRNFRFIAARLFRFGANFYRLHQPHFLAEFLLENLDPQREPGAIDGEPEFYDIAVDALDRALAALRRHERFDTDSPESLRRFETWRDLKAAAARLTQLRADRDTRSS
jgi:hypothetical protein